MFGNKKARDVDQAAAEQWPDGVVARYKTVGGATVDVTNDRSPHWHCTGAKCPGTSVGAYTGPWGDPFTSDVIHEQSQEHAKQCRAMPKPDGSPRR